jgi:FkbM family methyltransferase
VLKLLWSGLARSRTGRYWLWKVGNSDGFQPVFNVLADRVYGGLLGISRLGFVPAVVVDIGAYSGEWTQRILQVFPTSKVVMIEAQPAHRGDLERIQALAPSRITYEIALLGEKCAEHVEFFVGGTGSSTYHEDTSGSSIYHENTSYPRHSVFMPMTTLDVVMAAHAPTGEVFLKLDVQGAELDVLKGAPCTLERTSTVLLEASIVEYNVRAPRIAAVISFMRDRGFVLFDIWDLRRIGPVLAQVDLLFTRCGSILERAAAESIRSYGASSSLAMPRQVR